MPGVFALSAVWGCRVNLPVGLLIWVMIIPMLRIDFGALGRVKAHWRGDRRNVDINWLD